MNYKFLIIISLFISLAYNAKAQNESVSKPSVFENLSTVDSLTGAKVKVIQDKRIEEIITNRKDFIEKATTKSSGYRVQVFSSNVQRTAKIEAFNIEKEIRQIYPEVPVYVSYTSPFWKVRVGDFAQIEQANNFKVELINTFPNFKSETYTVRDQINVPVIK